LKIGGIMDLNQAIDLIKTVVKDAGNVNFRHIDLNLVSAEKRETYEMALMVSQKAIKEGAITKEEFMRKVHLEN
jgi:3-oxoacyl-[acyl-carrier-protein] synthase III